MTWALPLVVVSVTIPRLELTSPKTVPKYCSGVVISAFTIGSRMTGSHFWAASLKAMAEAVL